MVDKYKIQGGNQLKGEVLIGGAKNSVLKLMASAVLAKGETKIYNVPELTDVGIMLEVINGLGIKTNHDKKEQSVTIDATVSTGYIKELLHVAEQQDLVAQVSLESTVKLLLIVELNRAEQERLTFPNVLRMARLPLARS